MTARLSNATALLKEKMGFFWVGFYLVKDDQLILGPFQGSVACMRIGYGRGVCGTAWKDARTIVVPDVEEFPGHIACSSLSKSEIVVPIFNENEIVAVLDIDSDELATFDSVDAFWLERFVKVL
ncbi:MAG: GAF domain-containing protein [Bacteroidales bacterium]|nr:GAF domain-containing protein [Bacteroidales bacterium]